MKIGVAQLNSNDSTEDNLRQIRELLLSAASEKPAVIFFPENSLYFRIDPSLPMQAVSVDGPEIREIAGLCARTGINVHLTTPVEESGRIYNATIWIDQTGQARVIYRKIHLFDIELSGQKPIRESDSFAHGKMSSVTEVQNFRIGNSICYDVRFAELFSAYARAEVDIIAVPAAFLVKTGQAHWEILLRARAIESQCYIVAAAQAGEHRARAGSLQRETYGNSMVVNPWGEVSALKPAGVGMIFSEIDREFIHHTRGQIPMKSHRRVE